jgi:hypothetical protein
MAWPCLAALSVSWVNVRDQLLEHYLAEVERLMRTIAWRKGPASMMVSAAF